MISEEKVEARIKEIAEQINQDFAGESVTLVCILKGSIFFTTELAKYITVPVTIDFMQCSSYGADTKSSGIVKLAKDLDEPIMGKHVILIEDIIDSGRTLSHLVKLLYCLIYLMTAKISFCLTMMYSSSSNFTSVPEYFSKIT